MCRLFVLKYFPRQRIPLSAAYKRITCPIHTAVTKLLVLSLHITAYIIIKFLEFTRIHIRPESKQFSIVRLFKLKFSNVFLKSFFGVYFAILPFCDKNYDLRKNAVRFVLTKLKLSL